MKHQESSLHKLVRDAVAPDRFAELSWRGDFAEYLSIVERNPSVARNAWQRLLDMVETHGFVRIARKERRAALRRWKIFDDPFSEGSDAVYGLDEPLAQLVQTIRAGARGLGPERRVILLHGPVGSSKSTIVRLLKRGLEAYAKTEDGALYTFDWVIDDEVTPSPMNQDPLLLIPEDARAAVEERLNRGSKREYRLTIQGELDPVSRHFYRILMERHAGDWTKVVEHVRVRRLLLSEKDRVGIGTFQPKDEKNQDSTELTGDLNYRKIAEFGSDSDPRAFNFDGEFNVANRGILEFVEVLKLDVAFLYDLLGATQEHSIKPRKFAQTHIDEVILGHTNEPEYKKLASNDLMEAFRDRTIKIDIPYNLSVSDEVEIYRRQFGRKRTPGGTMAPHTLEIASLWAVLTRLEDPTHPNLTLLQKARLYDGVEVQGFTREQVHEMHEAAPREGMVGISPRYVQDRIATCLASDRPGVTALDVLEALEDGLRHHSMISNEETRRRYVQLLATAREEYEEIVKREVQAAIVADHEAVERLCGKYLDNLKAYITREKVLDATGRESDPDERLMRSIEEKIDIPESRKSDFRHELLNYIAAVQAEGATFDFRQNARLRRALELKVFEDRRDTIQLTSSVSSVVDPDTQQKIGVIRDRLMREFGYDEVSADEVLQHVAGLFARGEAKRTGSEAA
ncbi:MAG: PrkA family serine protein kinase [Planctomycetota bacterium]